MANTSTDRVQLILEIGGKEQSMATLKDLRSAAKDLTKQINNAEIGSKEFIEASKKLSVVNDRLKEVTNGVKNVGKEMDKAGSGFKGFASGVGDSLKSLAPLGAAAIGAFAVDKIIEFGKGAISAFNEAENATFQMRNAMVVLGGETEATFQRLMDQADMLEQTTFGFSAEQIQNTQKELKQFGLMGDEIEKLTPKILDYATATGKDLATATDDVTNAMLGKDKALQKVGISLDKSQLSVQGVTDSLDKFAGTASSALEVGTNKLEVMADKWGMIEEAVGGFLVNAGFQLIEWLTPVAEGLAEIWAGLVRVYDIFQAVIIPVKSFFGELSQSFPFLIKIKEAFSALFTPLSGLATGLKTLAAYWQMLVAGAVAGTKTIRDIWGEFGTYAANIWGNIGNVIGKVFSGDFSNVGAAVDKLKGSIAGAAKDIGSTFIANYNAEMAKFKALPDAAAVSNVVIKDRKIKPEADAAVEAAKKVEIARKEAEAIVKINKDKTEKVIESDKKQVEEKEIDYQKLAQQQNDANKKALEGADLEVEIANKVRIAKVDMAILAAKNEDELRLAKIAKIITLKDIELENENLTAAEKLLIRAKSEADIAALQQEWADKEVEMIVKQMEDESAIKQSQIEKEKSLNEQKKQAAIDIAKAGLDALMQFSQMETAQKIAGFEKEKDARIKNLDSQLAKGKISEEKYAKSKEAIEKDSTAKIAAIKTEQARKDKAAAIIQAAINTAVAVTAGMASPAIPPFPSAIAAGIVGALQIALIAAKPLPTFAKGGIARGASHAQGGIQMYDSLSGNQVGEMEGGEPYMILSKNSYSNNKPIIDRLLYSSMYKNGEPIFANGGMINSAPVTVIPRIQSLPGTSIMVDNSQLIIEIRALKEAVQQQQTKLEAYITYSSLENSIEEVNTIRNRAKRN